MDKRKLIFVIAGGMITTTMYCAEPYLSLAQEQLNADFPWREAKLPDDGKTGWGPRWLNTHEIATQIASTSSTFALGGEHYSTDKLRLFP